MKAVATTVVEGLPLPDRVEGGATFTTAAAAAAATFTTATAATAAATAATTAAAKREVRHVGSGPHGNPVDVQVCGT